MYTGKQRKCMYLNRDNIRGGYKHPKFNDDLRDCKGCIGKQRKCMYLNRDNIRGGY